MTRRILSKGSLEHQQVLDQDYIILIDKPYGWTSFDVVKKIRNLGRFRKVGHAGTLDPFATGLLILGTGVCTRQLRTVSDSDKEYEGVIEFGEERDTYDVTGSTVHSTDPGVIDMDLIRQKAEQLTGESEQIPPMYSARKINGQRLYKLARNGIVVERKPQSINIKAFRVRIAGDRSVSFRVSCSKGTYIRSLAHDLGRLTGYGAYLKALRRLSINGYSLDNALTIAEFQHLWSAVS